METVNDRIEKVFHSLNIKQFEFADKIGVSQAYISKLFKENSDKNPSERIIKIICSEFNVNEEWLRYGQGEMFIENDSTILSSLADEYNLDSLDKKIIEGYLNLTSEQRKVIKTYVNSLSSAINGEIAVSKDEEDDIERELESYRLELEAEKRGRMLSASENLKGKNIG